MEVKILQSSTCLEMQTFQYRALLEVTGHIAQLVVPLEGTATLKRIKLPHFEGLLHKESHLKMKLRLHSRCVKELPVALSMIPLVMIAVS